MNASPWIKRYPTTHYSLESAFMARMMARYDYHQIEQGKTPAHYDLSAWYAINHYAEQLAVRYRRMFGGG